MKPGSLPAELLRQCKFSPFPAPSPCPLVGITAKLLRCEPDQVSLFTGVDITDGSWRKCLVAFAVAVHESGVFGQASVGEGGYIFPLPRDCFAGEWVADSLCRPPPPRPSPAGLTAEALCFAVQEEVRAMELVARSLLQGCGPGAPRTTLASILAGSPVDAGYVAQAVQRQVTALRLAQGSSRLEPVFWTWMESVLDEHDRSGETPIGPVAFSREKWGALLSERVGELEGLASAHADDVASVRAAHARCKAAPGWAPPQLREEEGVALADDWQLDPGGKKVVVTRHGCCGRGGKKRSLHRDPARPMLFDSALADAPNEDEFRLATLLAELRAAAEERKGQVREVLSRTLAGYQRIVGCDVFGFT